MPKNYKRILIKLSGDFLAAKDGKGLDFARIDQTTQPIINLKKKSKIDICTVVGAGNFIRYRHFAKENLDRVMIDYMGMLSGIINSLALEESFKRQGTDVRVMTSVSMPEIAEHYIYKRALRHLSKNRIIIFGGGVGKPFFTHDTAAALKACEMKCDVFIKVTDVDGVYDADPNKNPKAKLYQKLSYSEALKKKLKVMDNTAFALCQENKIPIVVMNVKKLKDLDKVIKGGKVGTLVG